MGTCWAYATSNLQGVINQFVEGGGPFDEIWLHEGTYTLDPNKNPSGDWADEIAAGDRTDEKSGASGFTAALREPRAAPPWQRPGPGGTTAPRRRSGPY